MRLWKNLKGALTAGTIVALAVGFLLVAILTPIAMQQLVNANTTGWDTAVKTIFATVLPILFIIGVAIKYIPGKKGD
jgi:type IV secretory pathway VirB2 component (pilin)